MAKLSKITGSIIVASLLFSMTGCGDDDKNSTESTEIIIPSTNNSDSSKLTQAETNQITRNTQKNHLTTGDIAAQAIALKKDLKNEDGSSIETGRDLLIYFAEGDKNELAEIANYSEKEISTLILEASLAGNSETSSQKTAKASSQKSFFDKIKDGLADIMGAEELEFLMTPVFELMLKSGTVTKEALQLAIGSNTIMKGMIGAFDNGWSDIAPSMQPLLENDIEFGHLFMTLALAHGGRNGISVDADGNPILDANGSEMPRLLMAEFLFSRIDAPMYHSLTIGMSNSRTSVGDHEGAPGYMTEVLSNLMARPDMAKFFEIPTDLEYTDAMSNTAFSKLLFSNGEIIKTVDGVTTGHGDGSELANERFFYEMFATPESTTNFITAMNNVQNNPALGEDTKIALMSQIFLAANDITETDEEQAYHNIYAIAGGMAKGLGEGGDNFAKYQDNFIGFAALMPYTYDSVSYAGSFIAALSSYFDNNESAYGDEFKTLFRGTAFDVDNNDSLISYYFSASDYVGGLLEYVGVAADDAVSYVNNIDFDTLYYGTTKIQFFSDIPESDMVTFKNGKYSEFKLYGSELTWDYIPNRFAEKDWVKATATTQTANFDWNSGSVSAYVISSSELDAINADTGLIFTQVDLNGNVPLSSDVNASYNVYTTDIANKSSFNLSALTGSTLVSAVFLDADQAVPNDSELDTVK